MKRLLKILAYLIGAVVLLIIAAVIIVPLVFDPNDHKDDITALVKQHTGRELQIPGNIELSIFPWLGVETGKLTLNNAAGFGDKPFAKIEHAAVRVKLLPLISGDIKVSTIILEGLALQLKRKANGQTNWEDLSAKQKTSVTGSEQTPSTDDSKPPTFLAALAIGGIDIHDANIVWDDQFNKKFFQISNFGLEMGALQFNTPFPLSIDFDFASKAPKASGHIDLQTQINLDITKSNYVLTDLKFKKSVNSPLIPAGNLNAELTSKHIELNLAQQTANLQSLHLKIAGINIHSDIKAKQILDTPKINGTLRIDDFVPRELFKELKLTLPKTADESVLTKANFVTQLDASPNHLALSKLDLRFDDSQLKGKLRVTQFSQPAIKFDLNLDRIDADRYLPPADPSTRKTATPASGAAAAATQLPIEQLRALNVKGKVTIQQAKLSNLRSKNIQLNTSAKKGLIRLYPLKAEFYEGSYSGDLGLDVRGKQPRITMNETLTGIQIGPLLKDFMGDDLIKGTAHLQAKLTAQGLDPVEIRKTLNGTANFNIKNGTLSKVNLNEMINQSISKYIKQPAPKEKNAKITLFTTISGSAKIKNGLVRNDDFKAVSKRLKLNGKGTANLVNEALHYDVNVIPRTTIAIGNEKYDKHLAALKDKPIPLEIRGTLPNPAFKLKAGKVLEQLAKTELKQKTNEKIKKEKDKLKDKLLKKLFKF